ncbi:Spo0B domain-containing protein [Halobacillus litoralis]|uniref:Spo0B domain-containing protein n=1 Tax=Halobacillus litoralis TaxID=45668 RepID=UPI001CD69E5C|nr:Spo0B domain-containing protein [Halobacillus litoralis]MCA1021721.1 sporulation initiation phosphotransferase B [Halobacillus litoralis]
MEEKEIIGLLRHKRHDWMNQIQLIQGYASLGKHDRLMDLLDTVKAESEEERKLLNAEASAFPLWLLTFNWIYASFRLTYSLEQGLDLSSHDQTLTAYGRRLMEIMEKHKDADELYEGTVTLYRGGQGALGLSWEWDGRFPDPEPMLKALQEEGCIASIYDRKELSIEMTIE